MKTYTIFMVCSAMSMLMGAANLQARSNSSIAFSGAVTVPACSITQARMIASATNHHELATATSRYACPNQGANAAADILGVHAQHSVQISAQLAATSPLLAYFVDYTSANGHAVAHVVTRTFE
ncbi:MAG TPA: hypothetical protein VIL60_11145 [Rhodanobacter sp.]